MDRVEQAKSKSLMDLLLKNGYTPKDQNQFKYWYNSPFRAESKPSFAVRLSDGKWKDYGEEDTNYQDIIDFVVKYNGVSFSEALDIILEGKIRIKSPKIYTPPEKNYFEIKDKRKVANKRNIHYFYGRKIDIDLLRLYCEALDVVFPNSKNPEVVYSVVGFPNKHGGYEVRTEWLKTTLTPSYYSWIEGKSNNIYCFEGFTSFLSYLVSIQQSVLIPNVIVFNGNGNWRYAEQVLKEASKVSMFLDNDKSGDKTLKRMADDGIEYEDKRSLYRNYNDLNDYICGFKKKTHDKKKKRMFLEQIQKTGIYRNY